MKYYYTDKIIANYMEEKFGIRYETLNGLPIKNINGTFYSKNCQLDDDERLYVRGNLQDDFKAIDGDFILFPPCGATQETYGHQVIKHPDGGICIFSDQLGHAKIESKYEIIMRDGQHFFMPEVEE